MQTSIGEHPTAQNCNYPYMVLVDLHPDAGPLYGFFSFQHKNRTISGKLFRDLTGAIGFLRNCQNVLADTLGEDGLAVLKVRVVLLDRMGVGAVLGPADLRNYAQVMYFRTISHRRLENAQREIVERAGQIARMKAERLISGITWKMRASPTLLNNEDPLAVLNRHMPMWSIDWNNVNASYSQWIAQLFDDYRNDASLPAALREGVHKVDTYLAQSLKRVMLAAKARLSAQERDRMGETSFIRRQALFNSILDKAELDFNRTGSRDLMFGVLRNRINFMDAAALDAYVGQNVAMTFTRDYLTRALFTAVPDGETKYPGQSSYDVVRPSMRQSIQISIDPRAGTMPTSVYVGENAPTTIFTAA